MFVALLGLAAASTLSSTVPASAQPVVGPVPDWVRPIAPPPVAAASGDQTAVRILLQDQQTDLQPGHITRYVQNVYRLQTTQGLAAGHVNVSWDPALEAVTVHHVRVRRGDKTIDVLANQQFTVVRRETNLENAVLDGRLTATLQPEGLQVGDVLDIAMSVTRSDPAVGRHVEQMAGGWNGLRYDRAHFLIRWPSATRMRVRTTTGLPALKPRTSGGVSSIELEQDDLPPLPVPKGAPPRFGLLRVAEASDYGSWADLARAMAPLYTKASTLAADSAVAKEVDAIAARTADPKARAEAALALVQGHVRYVLLAFNDGGLVPADADQSWQRRFGDCKGKTALLLAMLHRLGIDAVPVLVNMSGGGDGMDERLPMLAMFDHVLVRATIAGRSYWLDGTRTDDRSLDKIETPDVGWGLPLVPDAALVRMEAPMPPAPLHEVAIRIDASKGLKLPALFHVERSIRGDEGYVTNLQLSNLAGDTRDTALRDYWRGQYSFVTVKTVSASYDAARREARLVMDGTAALDWTNGWYEADGVGVGYNAEFTRDPGPNRDAPYRVSFPYWTHVTETILLPPGSFRVDHGEPVDVTVAGIRYHRKATLTKGRFEVEEDERAIQREFPAAEAPAAQTLLHDLNNKNVFLGAPTDYQATPGDIGEALNAKPTDVEGFRTRAGARLDTGAFQLAVDDFTAALAKEPGHADTLARRGLAYALLDRPDEATRDLDAAEKINPKNMIVPSGRAAVAISLDRPAAAIPFYTRALEGDPTARWALSRRARAYHRLGKDLLCLADLDALDKLSGGGHEDLDLRANALIALGRSNEALALARTADADGASPWSRTIAAMIYARIGQRAEAMRVFDTALKSDQIPSIYAKRSLVRARDDIAGRQADLDAATKTFDPSIDVQAAQAQLHEDRKAFAAAVAIWSKMIEHNPEDAYALVRRGIDQQRLGARDLAAKDFAAAHALAKDDGKRVALCRQKSRAGFGLDMALDECRTAVASDPTRADRQEALGWAELAAGHVAEARAAFSKALTTVPTMASALYGRSLAAGRGGDAAAATADRAAALRLDPQIETALATPMV